MTQINANDFDEKLIHLSFDCAWGSAQLLGLSNAAAI